MSQSVTQEPDVITMQPVKGSVNSQNEEMKPLTGDAFAGGPVLNPLNNVGDNGASGQDELKEKKHTSTNVNSENNHEDGWLCCMEFFDSFLELCCCCVDCCNHRTEDGTDVADCMDCCCSEDCCPD